MSLCSFISLAFIHVGEIVVKADVLRSFILLNQGEFYRSLIKPLRKSVHQKQCSIIKFARNKRISKHPHIGLFPIFSMFTCGRDL